MLLAACCVSAELDSLGASGHSPIIIELAEQELHIMVLLLNVGHLAACTHHVPARLTMPERTSHTSRCTIQSGRARVGVWHSLALKWHHSEHAPGHCRHNQSSCSSAVLCYACPCCEQYGQLVPCGSHSAASRSCSRHAWRPPKQQAMTTIHPVIVHGTTICAKMVRAFHVLSPIFVLALIQ
jgi:hypothetical protein